MKPLDIIGKRFGRLVVISREENNQFGNTAFKCLCDCGKETVTLGNSLRSGRTKSCGCLSLEIRTTHGMKKSRIYNSWEAMKQRCLNEKSPRFSSYGGRGIGICERWLKFENFFADMGERPECCSLDRIDNDGNYEPGNCRWATNKEQSNNRRNTISLELNGMSMTLAQWSRETGIKYKTLHNRFRNGWTPERILKK